MEENIRGYKKKIGIAAASIILAENLICTGINMLVSHISLLSETNATDIEKYKTLNQFVGVGLSVLSLVIIFIASYIFTKDKRKTVIFAGSIYFGENTAAIISSLISAIAKSLTSAAILSPDAQSAIVFAGKLVSLPIMIALAYFAFTAFEGINSKISSAPVSSQMLLSEAKKRYLIAYVLLIVISAILTSAPSFIFAYATSFGIINTEDYTPLFSAVSLFLSWISNVIGFAIFYFIGFKPYKSRTDAISFVGVSAISGAVSSLIISVVMMPVNTLLASAANGKNLTLIATLSTVAGLSTFVVLAIDIALSMYLLKFFFEKTKISLFTDDAPEISIDNGEYSSVEI